MRRRVRIPDWCWRLTHPRAARERAEELELKQVQQRALTAWKEHREQELQFWEESRPRRNEWLHRARDPHTPSDELQNIVNEYKQEEIAGIISRLTQHTPDGISWHTAEDSPEVWDQEFQRNVCANPNLPTDLFLSELLLTEHTVAGFLQNPVCPLLLLEYPDFVNAFGSERQLQFAAYALRQENVPRPLLQALTGISEQWLALEAQTHIGNALSASETENTERRKGTPLDLTWLDQQILERVRTEEFDIRCQLYELAWHGLIRGEVASQLENPWQDTDFHAQLRDLMRLDSVEQCVQEAKRATRLGGKAQDEWTARWKETMKSHVREWCSAATFHPEMPFWAVCEIKSQAKYSLSWPAVQHPDAPPEFVAACREADFHSAISPYTMLFSPCVFYLALRDAPQNLLRKNLYGIARRSKHFSFLVRLAVALRSDELDSPQQDLRLMFWNDPNYYVRAAARKEIFVSGQTT